MCIPDRPTGARPTHPRLYTRRTHARPFVPVFVCITSSPVLGAAHRGRPLEGASGVRRPRGMRFATPAGIWVVPRGAAMYYMCAASPPTCFVYRSFCWCTLSLSLGFGLFCVDGFHGMVCWIVTHITCFGSYILCTQCFGTYLPTPYIFPSLL
ncbi:hypothetical protein B0H11DRAFT_2043312, partial [Mycena galericulata]